MNFLLLRTCSSSEAADDEPDATSNDSSLELPHQASMTPGRLVEPDPCSQRQDQQDEQASLPHLFHVLPLRGTSIYIGIPDEQVNCS